MNKVYTISVLFLFFSNASFCLDTGFAKELKRAEALDFFAAKLKDLKENPVKYDPTKTVQEIENKYAHASPGVHEIFKHYQHLNALRILSAVAAKKVQSNKRKNKNNGINHIHRRTQQAERSDSKV